VIGDLALALALLELVFLLAVVVFAWRAWHKVAPSITPLLSMFAPAPAAPSLPIDQVAQYWSLPDSGAPSPPVVDDEGAPE
jgi:hypothetical protein